VRVRALSGGVGAMGAPLWEVAARSPGGTEGGGRGGACWSTGLLANIKGATPATPPLPPHPHPHRGVQTAGSLHTLSSSVVPVSSAALWASGAGGSGRPGASAGASAGASVWRDEGVGATLAGAGGGWGAASPSSFASTNPATVGGSAHGRADSSLLALTAAAGGAGAAGGPGQGGPAAATQQQQHSGRGSGAAAGTVAAAGGAGGGGGSSLAAGGARPPAAALAPARPAGSPGGSAQEGAAAAPGSAALPTPPGRAYTGPSAAPAPGAPAPPPATALDEWELANAQREQEMHGGGGAGGTGGGTAGSGAVRVPYAEVLALMLGAPVAGALREEALRLLPPPPSALQKLFCLRPSLGPGLREEQVREGQAPAVGARARVLYYIILCTSLHPPNKNPQIKQIKQIIKRNQEGEAVLRRSRVEAKPG
jgi:hypothetical protein